MRSVFLLFHVKLNLYLVELSIRGQKYASTCNKANIRPKVMANYSLVMKNLFTAASYVKNIIKKFVIEVYNQEMPS